MTEIKEQRSSLLAKVAILLVRFYQIAISPLKRVCLGPFAACRFYPTCSQYALESFRRFGFFHGFWLALKRLLRCHPFHPGGEDPVPFRPVNRRFGPIKVRKQK